MFMEVLIRRSDKNFGPIFDDVDLNFTLFLEALTLIRFEHELLS